MKEGDKIQGYYRHQYEVVRINNGRCYLKKKNGEIFSFGVDVLQMSINAGRSKLIERRCIDVTNGEKPA